MPLVLNTWKFRISQWGGNGATLLDCFSGMDYFSGQLLAGMV